MNKFTRYIPEFIDWPDNEPNIIGFLYEDIPTLPTYEPKIK